MSNKFYSKWLIKSKDNLEKVMEYDLKLIEQKANLKDPTLANQLIGGLYSRYAMAVQDLDHCLDQLIQVQKNFTVRKITEAAATRLNELKEELIKLDISEYHYIDGALIELKLIPHDVEILNPTLVVPRIPEYEDMWKRLKNDETIYEGSPEDELGEVEGLLKKKKKKRAQINPMALLMGPSPSPSPRTSINVPEEIEEEEEPLPIELHEDIGIESQIERSMSKKSSRFRKLEKKKRPCNRPKVASQLEAEMSQEEKDMREKRMRYQSAIILIQSHERARQGRLYVHDMVEGRKGALGDQQTGATQSHGMDEEEEEDPRTHAAIVIQTWWRKCLDAERKRRRETRLRILIGMVEDSHQSKEVQKSHKSLELRRNKRYEAMREYYNKTITEKARVLKVVAPGLFEDIGDEIRQWFKDWWYTCKVFQDIPPAAEGGTILVVRGDVESPDDHRQAMAENERTGGKAAEKKKKEEEAKKAKEAKEAAEKTKKAKEKKPKAKKGNMENVELVRTAALDAMAEGFEEYKTLWNDVNDADNPENKPYMDVITEKMCYEVQMEVRPKVDELMRLELQILKGASLREKKGGGKKGGKGNNGGKKGKKEKGGKAKKKGGKGKKGKKDPTGERKVEALFQELYQKGIIRKYPEVYISDYCSDFSYQNYEKRQMLLDPPATLRDAQWAVIMNCIFPLGISQLNRPKSILLAGPRGSSLDVLANAVFTETQCVLFDLTPENIEIYPGKKGNKDLTHLVSKMAKLLQPSVIYIGDCERAFYKKMPKDEKGIDPRRVGKILPNIIKAITINDQVQVLGTSYYPFLGQAAKMKKVFQKIILVPRSDYGSIYLFLQEHLMRYHGVDRNFNISALATLSKYYPLPLIKEAIENVMIPDRIIQLHFRPLEAVELVNAMQDTEGPVTDKEWEKYVKFYAGTKLAKARKAMNAKNAKLIEAMKKKEAAAKMKKP